MSLPTLTTLDVPLRIDETGTIRVGKTRILLELVVDAFHQGEPPEHIVDMYDVLRLGEVYAVIAYYLQHQVELDAYLQQRQIEADALQRQIQAQPGYEERRARLLTRRQPGQE
jgi:uncharacterized protein (DUF433 family)